MRTTNNFKEKGILLSLSSISLKCYMNMYFYSNTKYHLLFLYAFQIRTVVSQDDEIYCIVQKYRYLILKEHGTKIMHTAKKPGIRIY